MDKSIFAYQTVPNISLSIKLNGNLVEFLAYYLKKKLHSNRSCDFFLFDRETGSSSKKCEPVF